MKRYSVQFDKLRVMKGDNGETTIKGDAHSDELGCSVCFSFECNDITAALGISLKPSSAIGNPTDLANMLRAIADGIVGSRE